MISLRIATGVESEFLTAYLHMSDVLEGNTWREVIDEFMRRWSRRFGSSEFIGLISLAYKCKYDLSSVGLEAIVQTFSQNSQVLWESTDVDPIVSARDFPGWCSAGTKCWNSFGRLADHYVCAVIRTGTSDGSMLLPFALIPEERVNKDAYW